MKTLIVIETAEELIRCASMVRANGDDSPSLPKGAQLVFDGNMPGVSLANADGFTMQVPAEDIITALVKYAGMGVHMR